MSNSVRPHRRQPTRLPVPGILQARTLEWLPFPSPMRKSESEVAQSCLTPSDPMDCSLPGSPIHGIFQARVLEWGAIAFFTAWVRKAFSKNSVRDFPRGSVVGNPPANAGDPWSRKTPRERSPGPTAQAPQLPTRASQRLCPATRGAPAPQQIPSAASRSRQTD